MNTENSVYTSRERKNRRMMAKEIGIVQSIDRDLVKYTAWGCANRDAASCLD